MENILFLQTISSFDDISRKREWNKKKFANFYQSNKLAENTNDCDTLYYDSDPEDSRERTLNRGPRIAMARQEEEVTCNESKTKRREALNILDSSHFGVGRKWRRLGQEVLFDIIEVRQKCSYY